MNRTLRGVWLEVRVIPVFESVTQCEMGIIFSGIAAALIASTLLVSALAAALLVAVAVVVAELRLAGPPPEHAPA